MFVGRCSRWHCCNSNYFVICSRGFLLASEYAPIINYIIIKSDRLLLPFVPLPRLPHLTHLTPLPTFPAFCPFAPFIPFAPFTPLSPFAAFLSFSPFPAFPLRNSAYPCCQIHISSEKIPKSLRISSELTIITCR